MIDDHPGRFGMFAALPLPDIERSLKEIEYALDTLKADGVGLMTSYRRQVARRPGIRAGVRGAEPAQGGGLFPPDAANCCGNYRPAVLRHRSSTPTDTTRAIPSLFYSGASARYPDIRFIFSHAGGTMPALPGRIADFVGRDKNAAKYAPTAP